MLSAINMMNYLFSNIFVKYYMLLHNYGIYSQFLKRQIRSTYIRLKIPTKILTSHSEHAFYESGPYKIGFVYLVTKNIQFHTKIQFV